MMRKEYKLSHFFLLYTLLVLGLVAFVMYGKRDNAPSNIYVDDVDVSAPYYNVPEEGVEHEVEIAPHDEPADAHDAH